MKKRRWGKGLMLAGSLLVLAALLLTISNLWEENRAQRASAAVLAVLEESIEARRAQSASSAQETPQIDAQPELQMTDAQGRRVDWPTDAQGAPMPWPTDASGNPAAETTDALGAIHRWADLPAADWPAAPDGSLLPYVTDAQGCTMPWPTDDAGLPMRREALVQNWRDFVEQLYREILESAAQPEFVRNPQMQMPTYKIDGRAYIGVLEVPSKDLTLPVMSEWSYSALRIAPCRYAGSAYSGDLVIAGHNYARHFSPVKRLKAGDKVDFTDADGNVFHYVVSKLETLEKTEVDRMIDADGWDLTLFTCNSGGSRRVAVRCVMESCAGS